MEQSVSGALRVRKAAPPLKLVKRPVLPAVPPVSPEERCGGCRAAKRAAGPLCAKCWPLVPVGLMVEYEGAILAFKGVGFDSAKVEADWAVRVHEKVILEAGYGHRAGILLKLWKTKWKKRFAAKHGLDAKLEKLAEPVAVEEDETFTSVSEVPVEASVDEILELPF